jgi:molybdenum cofactor cytidylyltransferase
MSAPSLPGPQIIVLAAGFSARLGQPKALAHLRGMSLLRRVLQCAATLTTARVIAVVPRNAVRYRAQARGMKVTFVENSARHAGLSGSVRRGIVTARCSRAVLLMPVDLPNLKSRELSRMIRRWRAAPRCVIARRIRARDTAPFGAAPLILPRRLYPRALVIAGDVGLRELIAQLPANDRVLVDMPSAAWDIDTPEDLRAARHSFRSQR